MARQPRLQPGVQRARAALHAHVHHARRRQHGLFGHLLLPGGSANLGEPAYALEAGSEAPLVGVVMQVIEVAPLADGRLQVTAAGLCRFEVVRARQTTPYSRADVRPLPDDDEVAAYSGQASRMLARVRAAAEGLEWASREVSWKVVVSSE